MTDQQLAEYRVELLRQRVEAEMRIAQSLEKILMLAERCIEQSPWAMRILQGVYAPKENKHDR